MKLEIGKEYIDGFGRRFGVMGVVRHYPLYVWTLQGNWYRQCDGRYIRYDCDTGDHEPDVASLTDLTKEAKP